MQGCYRLVLEHELFEYDVKFKRKITFIRGRSASGKTTLADSFIEAIISPSIYKITCKTKFFVLPFVGW